MKYDIILSKEGKQYLAQVSTLPDIKVKETSREKALQRIKIRLQNYLQHVELVQVNVEEPNKANPWLEKFGSFQDDPTFDDWQAEIKNFQQKQNHEK